MKRHYEKNCIIYDVYGRNPQFGFQTLCARNPIAVVLEIFEGIIQNETSFFFQNSRKNERRFFKNSFFKFR